MSEAPRISSTSAAFRRRHNLESFFGRANYSYKNRYLLQASMRADGSSRFGVEQSLGILPGRVRRLGALRRAVHGQFRQSRSVQLKLRGSFGKTGNQSIPNFASLATYGSANYGGTPGIAPLAFANPNLKWESTKEWDGGLDWYPFGGRISDHRGLLSQAHVRPARSSRPLPCTIGYCSFFDNIGNVRESRIRVRPEHGELPSPLRGTGSRGTPTSTSRSITTRSRS